ncbi:MAG TPA: hypothetical protein VL285_14780 [Bryobacteraceae bacterium]|jgi:putative adhesin Stv-like protein|nr:hypothetical protein [Bryobacteraceae bacterium]
MLMITELSRHLLLHHPSGSVSHTVLISAHGGYRRNSPEVRIPAATTLIFTCMPGDVSILKVDQALTGYVHSPETFTDASPLKPPNYILTKFQDNSGTDRRAETYASIAASQADAGRDRKQAEMSAAGWSRELERLAAKDYEDWDEFDNKTYKSASKFMSSQPNMPAGMDVITIRRRRLLTHEVTLQEAIDAAQKHNLAYRTFICGFCRVLIS